MLPIKIIPEKLLVVDNYQNSSTIFKAYYRYFHLTDEEYIFQVSSIADFCCTGEDYTPIRIEFSNETDTMNVVDKLNIQFNLTSGGLCLQTYAYSNNDEFRGHRMDRMDIWFDPKGNLYDFWVPEAGRLPMYHLKFDQDELGKLIENGNFRIRDCSLIVEEQSR